MTSNDSGSTSQERHAPVLVLVTVPMVSETLLAESLTSGKFANLFLSLVRLDARIANHAFTSSS